MRTGDTIAAVCTAPGASARGIVRVSGPGTRGVLASVLAAPARGAGPFRGVLWLGRGGDPGRGGHAGRGWDAGRGGGGGWLPLPVCGVVFEAGGGYTGEDAAEIYTVGNPAVLDRVLAAVLACGGEEGVGAVRLAEPGEFSARAYLAGRLTLEQAEGVAGLIAAERDAELGEARELLRGEAGARYAAWADRVADLAALVEAGVDFTDQEDVRPISGADLAAGLDGVIEGIAGVLARRGASEAATHGARVALVGPPNAGKSTLFNALLGRERAVTADEAGTTRDVLAEPLALEGGGAAVLLDLPGLDASASDAVGRAAQAAARDAAAGADVVVACDPAGVFAEASGLRGEVLRVRTKADLGLGSESGEGGAGGSSGAGGLAVCALDGWRLDALRRAIADRAAGLGGGRVAPRHAGALREAVGALREARGLVDAGAAGVDEPELVAACLRAALDALGSVSGRVSPDDVIGRVFAAFCVGK